MKNNNSIHFIESKVLLRATYNHDDVSSGWNVSNGNRFLKVTIPIKLKSHEIVVEFQVIFKYFKAPL